MESYENIDIKRIAEVALSNKFFIILILVVSLLAGYSYSYYYKVPEYSSEVTILLAGDDSQAEVSKEITQTDLTINSGLIATYSNIATSSSVLEKTIGNLGLDMTVEQLQKQVTAKQVNKTQVLNIKVTSTDAETACVIANEISKVFTEQIKEIYSLENINVVDAAEVATTPYNVNHMKDLAIAGLIGMMISAVLVMAIYLLDDTIKDEKDITENAKLKSLIALPEDKDNSKLIIETNPKSHIVESIKTLRTNILYTSNKQTMLFTSYNAKAGKSWVVNNLAVAFAQANKKVLLVDANLRDECDKLEIFNIEKGEGLSDYIKELGEDDFENLEMATKYIKETSTPNLHILQSGTVPPNPIALISSENMKSLLKLFKSMYDLILIDGTSCAKTSESIALSSMVDKTVIVAENKKTKISDLKKLNKAIVDVNGNVLGVILNKAEVKKGKYYGKKYGYGYYYGKNTKDIDKIEEQQKTTSLAAIIALAKEKIENEVEVEPEVTEFIAVSDQQVDFSAESQKIQYEIKNVKNDLNTGIQRLVDISRRTSQNKAYEEKLEDIDKKIEAIDYNEQLEDLNRKIDAIDYDEKLESLNQKLDLINSEGKLEDLNRFIENIDYDGKLENLNQKLESFDYEEKLEDINRKIDAIDYDDKLDDLNQKLDSMDYEEKLDDLNRRMDNLDYQEQFANIHRRINELDYQADIEEIKANLGNNRLDSDLMIFVEEMMNQINQLNYEIRNLKQQQENGNSELVLKMENLEIERNKERIELLHQMNKVEEDRVGQNLAILGQISKMEAKREAQKRELLDQINALEESTLELNDEILDKLESLEENHRRALENATVSDNKVDNIISFEELQDKSKRTFNIDEDIKYEDLEELSRCVIYIS